MSYSAALEPLRAANLMAGRPLYDICNLPVSGSQSVSSSGAIVPATDEAGEQTGFDLILVVAGGDPARFSDNRIFQWLRREARRGVLMAGVSGGPVILARAGLMAGRRMTVHWEHAPVLAEISPDLMVERTLYVIDRDRMTCAGGTAPLDMMHALITRHHGPAFARQVSDWFLHTEIRPSGGPQRAGVAERYGTTNAVIALAIEAMENHIADPLDLGQVAQLSGIGPRQLCRLFKSRMDTSTMTFYRDLRLDKARSLIAQSTLSITEIALATGFSTSAHLSRCFRARFGVTPSSLRA